MKKERRTYSTRVQTLKARYGQLQQRLERALATGRFHEWSQRKQAQIKRRLARYARQLSGLPAAHLGKALLLTGLLSTSVLEKGEAQSFEIVDPINVFGLTDIGYNSSPIFADIDGDGDLDAFLGGSYGNTYFFRNTGTSTVPEFGTSESNPFGLTKGGYTYANLSLVDIDGDGDLDAFLGGDSSGGTKFFKNTGTSTAPDFASSIANPYNLTSVNEYGDPFFVDIDGDGDLDVFIGDYRGEVVFSENIGTSTAPDFGTSEANPFGLTDVGDYVSPSFEDIDGDGDFDAFLGVQNGNTFFFENTGTSTAAVFSSGVSNPFGLTNVGAYSKPTFEDIDKDGDLDAFIGNRDGNSLFFRNKGTSTAPVFEQEDNPVAFVCPSFNVSGKDIDIHPTLVDINGDGDLDVFSGSFRGNIYFLENTGTSTTPAFAAQVSNPYGLVDVGNNVSPSFVDIDGDGDLDAFIGNGRGNTYFFKNTGTSTAPAFAASVSNPYGLSGVDENASSTFIDIDGDGDLDALIGEYYGNMYFFENTGTSTAPAFAASVSNPFGLMGLSNYSSTPIFIDIDKDGDFDILSGGEYGNMYFFENTGTSAAPAFAASESNPFGFTGVGYNSSPAFADLDGDGDLDAFIGSASRKTGIITCFENTSPVVAGPLVVSTDKADGSLMAIDPCSCTDPLNQPAAPALPTLFHDILTVEANDGSTVVVSANNNNEFLNAAGSPIVASSAAATLVRVADHPTDPTLDIYQLDFYHRSGIAADIDISDGTTTISNFMSSVCTTESCEPVEPIPTMSEWGLLIFALLMMNLGLITVERKEQLMAKVKRKE